MSDALGKMRQIVAAYPGAALLDGFAVDYTDRVPCNAGLFPGGLVELSRSTDLLGNVTVTNQYNFALYAVLEKPPAGGEGADFNADWLMDFQEWVQAQSAAGLLPAFGDDPRSERVSAQNGAIYSAEDEGTAMYAVQLSAVFERHFERNW